MTDVQQWLDSLGLGQYAEAFEENDIDSNLLGDLTDEFLQAVGVASVGHRMKILKAVRDYAPAECAGLIANCDESIASSESKGEAEHRQLTVMFCDLVGSTALSESMDTEDYRDLLGAYQTGVASAIRRHDGYIARYMGDGLLVYFGYPLAQEDDPERAARAGLAIVDAVASLKLSTPLKVRVGVATGPVVVGDIIGEGASEEVAVLGETPNLAARLQAAADPNTVLLSSTTQGLLKGKVETQVLSPIELKGLSQPVVPHRVVRLRSLVELSDRRRDSSPLIGRSVEVALVERAWQHAQLSEGQAVLLSGEAGVGKSRLLRAFQATVKEDERTRVQWHCSPYYQTTANYPAVEQLKRSLPLVGQDANAGTDALASMVEDLGLNKQTVVPILALLLEVPLNGWDEIPALSPEQLRQQFISVQVNLLLAAARQAPVLLIVEDLHWADPTTLEVLSEMIAAIREARVLMLMTARPEFDPPWLGHSHALTQRLNSLTRNEAKALVQGLAEDGVLSLDIVEQIVERADGVPLFVEELTKNVLESEGDASVPASLQDSLMARLDRLGPSKELAQLASVIGREFSLDALCPLANWTRATVEQRLTELIDSGLVRNRAGGDYEFKHALIRDAAYNSMLRNTKRDRHARLAAYLESSQTTDAQPAVLAYHYTAANMPEAAIRCWQAAGAQALLRSASSEAVSHFSALLELLDSMPSAKDRNQTELEVRLALGPALVASKGFNVPEAIENYSRTARLCDLVGDQAGACLALRGQQLSAFTQGHFSESRALGAQMLERANSVGEPQLILGAHYTLGQSMFFLGEFSEALETLESGLQHHDPKRPRLVDWPGSEPSAQSHLYVAYTLWTLGFPEQAMQRAATGLTLSEATSNPVYVVMTECWVAVLATLLGDVDALTLHAEAAIDIASDIDHPTFLKIAKVLRGAGRVLAGDDEGINEVRDSLRAWRTLKQRAYLPFLLGLEAELSAGLGDVTAARVAIDEALRVSAETGDRAWHADLQRIHGVVALASSNPEQDAAEQHFREALATAHRQGARSLELRAAIGLGQLWRSQGKLAEARELIRPIYKGFTEGFKTRDLMAAEAILSRN